MSEDEKPFDKRPLNLIHEKSGPAQKAKDAQDRRDKAAAERAALWKTMTIGQQMRSVYRAPNDKSLLTDEERALRKIFHKDSFAYIREMLKHEAEEQNPKVVTPPKEDGSREPPSKGLEKQGATEERIADAGSDRARELIEQLIRECDAGGKQP